MRAAAQQPVSCHGSLRLPPPLLRASARRLSSTAMRTATPLVTCSSITECGPVGHRRGDLDALRSSARDAARARRASPAPAAPQSGRRRRIRAAMGSNPACWRSRWSRSTITASAPCQRARDVRLDDDAPRRARSRHRSRGVELGGGRLAAASAGRRAPPPRPSPSAPRRSSARRGYAGCRRG